MGEMGEGRWGVGRGPQLTKLTTAWKFLKTLRDLEPQAVKATRDLYISIPTWYLIEGDTKV